MGVEYKQLRALGHGQKGHSSVCSGATCKRHLLQGLGAKGGGAPSSWHSDLGRGPRRSTQQCCFSGCAVLRWVGVQRAGSLAPLLPTWLQPPAPPPLPQASSTCLKCHICLCWCPPRQARRPPPWTASPTSPPHPSTSAAGSAALRCPQVTAPTPVLGVLGQTPCPLCSIPEDESGWWGGFLSLGLSRRPLGFQEAQLT